MMWPFKWNLSACTFKWRYLFPKFYKTKFWNFRWILPLSTLGTERVKQRRRRRRQQRKRLLRWLARVFQGQYSLNLSITYIAINKEAVLDIECFHSRAQHLCKCFGTTESVCIRKEFNSQRIGLGHQHGRRFIVLGHQNGRRDVMWKDSIGALRESATFGGTTW